MLGKFTAVVNDKELTGWRKALAVGIGFPLAWLATLAILIALTSPVWGSAILLYWWLR